MAATIREPRVDESITLRDGRALAYAEWGDQAGRPVVLFHGGGNSRLLCPDVAATRMAGVRLITIDRPGYGRSDPRSDFTLLDWVDDYAEFGELVGLPPCPIVAWSNGGPYALACAARIPDRVPAIGLAASPAPLDEVPSTWPQRSPEVRDLIKRLRKDRASTVEDVTRRFAWRATDPVRRPKDLPRDHPDNAVFEDPAILATFSRGQWEGARQGVTGYVDDWIASAMPWGFSVAAIGCQAHIWWGDKDMITFRAEVDYLARTIARSILTIYPGEGHGILFTHWAEMLAEMR